MLHQTTPHETYANLFARSLYLGLYQRGPTRLHTRLHTRACAPASARRSAPVYPAPICARTPAPACACALLPSCVPARPDSGSVCIATNRARSGMKKPPASVPAGVYLRPPMHTCAPSASRPVPLGYPSGSGSAHARPPARPRSPCDNAHIQSSSVSSVCMGGQNCACPPLRGSKPRFPLRRHPRERTECPSRSTSRGWEPPYLRRACSCG